MTTRITLTILLTTWVVLLLGEAGAFYTARQILFMLFDANMVTRTITSLETELAGGRPFLPPGDEYIREEPIAETTSGRPLASKPQAALVKKTFEYGQG